MISFGSVLMTWAATNFGNPTGWLAAGFTAACLVLSIGASHVISAQATKWENENKQKWGVN